MALPPGPDPSGAPCDIGLPERVVAGDPHVDPQVITRAEQDRSPTTPTTDDGGTRRGQRLLLEDFGVLRAPQDERGGAQPPGNLIAIR